MKAGRTDIKSVSRIDIMFSSETIVSSSLEEDCDDDECSNGTWKNAREHYESPTRHKHQSRILGWAIGLSR